jgi:P-type Cu+ transporter
MRRSRTATSPREVSEDVCRHCGQPCDSARTAGSGAAHPIFCCDGCEAVFRLLRENGLDAFYQYDSGAGLPQRYRGTLDAARFAALDDPNVAAHVVEFDDGHKAILTFTIPAIHCASCVWLLEQLWRFDPGITRAEVDLQRRSVRVEYCSAATSPRSVAEQLAALGYEPMLAFERAGAASPDRRRLYFQLGVAGFAFGNIMLFSIPRYANGAPLTSEFRVLFGTLNLLLAIPVFLFSASDYFRTAWQAVRRATIALEVPVALGLLVLFGRSIGEIVSGRGEGFMDSFAGLVFFLLLGKLSQQRVFDRIAFDRTFRSFLPLSVRVEEGDGMRTVPLEAIKPGDCISVRRDEIVPADGRVLEHRAAVDYALITGEQRPILLELGDTVRAGGRALGALRVCVLREVSQSQLARLWGHSIFRRVKQRWLTDVASRFGAWFTIAAMTLAIAGAAAWWPDLAASASVATAVLIVACPCALTLSAPITLGTAMAELGRRGLFLKHAAVALDLSRIDTVIFDKTGTLTAGSDRTIVARHGLGIAAWALVRQVAKESIHPVSRAMAAQIDAPTAGLPAPRELCEVPGHGITALVGGVRVAIGSAAFVATYTATPPERVGNRTYVAAGAEIGWVVLGAGLRAGIAEAAGRLARAHDIRLLSGDHEIESPRWRPLFGRRMWFRQSPEDKLAFVEQARGEGRRVLMVGDGLNDAGALAAADVGLAVSDETACIVPACDAVISGQRLAALPAFLAYACRARQVVILCFAVSVVYNAAGLTLALTGVLTPLVSAILMPVSSLTIVGLSSGLMRWSAHRMLPV